MKCIYWTDVPHWSFIAEILQRELEKAKQDREDYSRAFSYAEAADGPKRKPGESDDDFRKRILNK